MPQWVQTAHTVLDNVFLAALALAPLALGGTHPLAAALLASLFVLLASGDILVRVASKDRLKVPAFVAVFVALCVFTMVRRLPGTGFLSPGLVREVWALWPESSARGHAAPALAGMWVIKTLGAVAAGYFAANNFSRTKLIWKPAAAIFAGAGVVVAVGVLQSILGADRILFFYEPTDWDVVRPFAGPFLNPNQAGSLGGLAAILALGSAYRTTSPMYRAGCILVAAVCAALMPANTATAAMLAFVASLLVFGVAAVLESRRQNNPRARRLAAAFAALTIAGALAAALLFLPVSWLESLGKTGNKALMWREALAGATRAPVFGYGPGSFFDVFPWIDGIGRTQFARNPENSFVELLFDHGIVLAVAVLVLAFIRPLRHLTEDHRALEGFILAPALAVGTYLALDASFGLAMQSTVYAVYAATLCGAFLGRLNRSAKRHRAASTRYVSLAAALAAALMVVSLAPSAVRASLGDRDIPLVPGTMSVDDMLRNQSSTRPLQLQALGNAVPYRLERDERQLAHDISDFVVANAPHRREPWTIAFYYATEAPDYDAGCVWFARFVDEFGEVPAAAVPMLRAMPDRAGCVRDHGAVIAEAAVQALSTPQTRDTLFAFAYELSTEDATREVGLRALIEASERPMYQALRPGFIAQLRALPERDVASELLLAREARQQGDTLTELEHLREAYDPDDPTPSIASRYIEVITLLAAEGVLEPDWFGTVNAIYDNNLTRASRDMDTLRGLQMAVAGAAIQAGQLETATRLLNALKGSGSPQSRSMALYRLGLVEEAGGHVRQAMQYYRDALDVYPRRREASDRLRELGD